MAASTQSTLENIERRRAQLQQSVEKLRKALAHWSTWEAEYDALKEEIQNVEDASPAQIREIARSLDSTLLDGKEVEGLLGKDLGAKRKANQAVDIISRRIDYVRQNSATIEKQLDAAEKQLAGVDVLLEPGMENEEGLPMMDIEEELDEAGNEVASSVNQTGKAAAEIVEVFRKAGLQKNGLERQKSATLGQGSPPDSHSSAIVPAASGKSMGPITEEQSESTLHVVDQNNIILPKKTVSSAYDSKPEASKKVSPFEKDGYNDELAYLNFTRGTKVIELDQDDNELASYPIIPQGESSEDAELRRQMLQYGLSEVGSIVAELDLDHSTVEYSDGDETDDEDEDQYGRSMKSVITDDYRKQMLELEKKLNARMMENVGPQANTESLADHAGDIRALRVCKDDQFDQSLDVTTPETPRAELKPKTESKKKGVRFADDLDVAAVPRPVQQPNANSHPPKKSTPTTSDSIVERSMAEVDAPVARKKAKQLSQFKSDKAGQSPSSRVLPNLPLPEPPAVPTGPTGRTLANIIIEHDPSSIEPNGPDEFDPVRMNHELRIQYNKARNNFIQQKDGFKPTEEDKENPIMEAKDGKTKKVSRFMSARLRANGM